MCQFDAVFPNTYFILDLSPVIQAGDNLLYEFISTTLMIYSIEMDRREKARQVYSMKGIACR